MATASMRLSRGPSQQGFASNGGMNKSPTAGTGRDGYRSRGAVSQ